MMARLPDAGGKCMYTSAELLHDARMETRTLTEGTRAIAGACQYLMRLRHPMIDSKVAKKRRVTT